MKKILVIGSTNIDNTALVDHIPAAGETIISHDFALHFGGKGANQAYAAGKLGGNVAFLSAIGTDGQGDKAMENLSSVGVDTCAVHKIDAAPTGLAWISVSATGENNIVVVPGANSALTPERIRASRETIEAADIVLVQLETNLEGIWEAIKIAGNAGKTVILDPAPAAEVPDDVLKNVNYITPNESELRLLTGACVETEAEIESAARKLLQRGAQNVLVTMGARGCMLVNAKGIQKYPSYPISAVDTTAAGDTFNAAFGVMLSKGISEISTAISFASAAAAVSATRKGAQESAPTTEETYEMMKRN